ncbi:MAG TPA: invasin domain 3-containing protein [Gemmatimonadales bacterium]|nr:invasin domain 3-containing protein [Gemmatimonadales bacterium]
MLVHHSASRGHSRPAFPSLTHPGVTERSLAAHLRAPLLLSLTALSACGGGELTLPSEGQPAEIIVARGNRQSGTTGEPLGDSLVVKVMDRFGNPVLGAEVTWTAEVGGSVSPATSVTAADGLAATERMLGATLGTYVTTAELRGVANDPEPAVFLATGVAARLALVVAPPAAATAGVPLSPQPALQLQDADGNDVAREGVIVTVQISSGEGELAGGTSATSNAAGRATFTDLAVRGSPGTRALAFTADGFASATAAVAVGVGAPAAIEPAAAVDQSAVVATAVPVLPAVLVRDADGNPLAGIPVTFRVTEGGGRLTGATPVTGTDGVATVGGWTLGQKVGANAVSAMLSGLDVSGSPVTFEATAMPGAVDAANSRLSASPAGITASSGSSRSTITVTARDAFDNAVPGAAVILAATGPGNALTQPGQPTGDDGTTAGSLSATTPGERVVSATIAGTPITESVTVVVSAGTPSAARSSATVPDGTAGQGTTIEIRLADAQGNEVAGSAGAIAVSVSGANSEGSVGVTDQGGGRYTAGYTPTKAGTDRVRVRVSGADVTGSPFSSDVGPGSADAGGSVAAVPACVDASDLPARITITAFDAFGNRITRGGDAFRLRVNEGAAITPSDEADGTYTADLELQVGIFRVDVTLDGAQVGNSPYQLVVPFPFSGC